MDLKKLGDLFLPADINWRIGQSGKGKQGIWAKVLAYLDARSVQDRFDAVCGPENWRNEYAVGVGGGVLCGISVRVPREDGKHEWVSKWDGAENTDIEAVKGGLSDAFKRAAVQWGCGRYLYSLGESWALISENGRYSAKLKEGDWFKWDPPKLPSWALPKISDIVDEPPITALAADDKYTLAAKTIEACTTTERLHKVEQKIIASKDFDEKQKAVLLRNVREKEKLMERQALMPA